jgi:branched-chain amino acid transport system substrate-binding protein
MSDPSRQFRFPLRRPLAVLACFGLAAALGGCGSSAGSATPGVTGSTITLGTHQPLTGPAAAGYSSISPATKAYFDYVNAQGGVNGRKIKYLIKDDGYNPANTQKVVRELVLKDKVFAIFNGLGTPTHTGVLGFLKTNKVPDLFVASGSRSWNQPTKYPDTFGFQPDYTTETKISATYIKQNFAGKKVCFLGQDDDFGTDALKGLQIVLGDGGVAEIQKYVVTNTNVAPQIGKLKSAGCQVVQLATVPGFTALALGTAAKLGFQPQWVSTSVGADLTTLKGALGKASGLLEGLLATNYLPSAFDPNDPWVKEFKKINAKYNNNAPFTGNTVYGMDVGYLFVQALKQNGKTLTRASIEKTIEKGKLTGSGIVPMRFSTKDHTGYGGARMSRISNGTQAYFGPTYTTDDGTGAPKVYNGAANTPPAGAIPKS